MVTNLTIQKSRKFHQLQIIYFSAAAVIQVEGLMWETDSRESASISAHAVVFFSLYQTSLASAFLFGKSCSHYYHVAQATWEHNDNNSLSHSAHTLIYWHTCSLFFCVSPVLLSARDCCCQPASADPMTEVLILILGLKNADQRFLERYWPKICTGAVGETRQHTNLAFLNCFGSSLSQSLILEMHQCTS